MIPYEFLVRWNKDGAIQGAHVIFQEVLVDSAGGQTSVIHPAQAVGIGEQQGFPLDSVLGEIQSASLKAIDELKEAHQTEIETLNTQHNTETENYQTQIAALNQELEALRNPPKPVEDWAGLAGDLLGSALFVKVRGYADQSIAASNAYTDLGLSLYAVHRWESFVRSVELIRSALSNLGADFTTEELNLLDQILEQNGFSALPR